jgi:probable rRNA maturation factor
MIKGAMPVDVQIAVDHDQLQGCGASLIERITQFADAVIGYAAQPATQKSAAGRVDPEVCIRVVNAEESRQLNATYRGKEKPTNVLSFPAQLDEQTIRHTELELLGDIVICSTVVADEAEQQNKRFTDHLAHMVIHGMLHLYGYDHQNENDAQQMEAIEREILDHFGVDDPYQEL